MDTNDQNSILSSTEQRAFRLAYLMDNVLKMSRNDFAKLVGVTKTSISFWRNPTDKRGLMESAAGKICRGVLKLGLKCNPSWLLHGMGASPSWITSDETEKVILPERQLEISSFLSFSKSAVVFRIQDNSMQPLYFYNDIVGGIWQKSNEIDERKTYIVEVNGQLQVRKLKATNKPNHFDLFSLSFIENPNYLYEMKNIYLEKVALIIRVWSN
ncbi:MAG: hypothetical protein LEGION0398_MBIBDBAK_00202 [Legionellaceae bacterium]